MEQIKGIFARVGSSLTRKHQTTPKGLPRTNTGWKGLPGTNTLDYDEHSQITTVKGLITLGPVRLQSTKRSMEV